MAGSEGPRRVLIAGVSTRAAAESAARAGLAVTAIDAFGDLDQHPSVRALSLVRDFGTPFTANAVARAARALVADAVVYLSNFENHPEAVEAMAEGRALWGNPPAVLRRVRDPIHLSETLRRRGLAAPEVFVAEKNVVAQAFRPAERPPSSRAAASAKPPQRGCRVGGPGKATASHAEAFMRRREALRYVSGRPHKTGRWLVKPLASGGGHDVRPWRNDDSSLDAGDAMPVPRGCYLQELVDGTPGAVVFVAAGGREVPLGVSRQLIGDPAFGATGYQYCGSILAAAGDAQFARDEATFDTACALARAVAEEFGTVGVNGIDFVARDGVAHAIEVNPRWCASMELVERAYDLSVFGAHAAACDAGTLPAFDLRGARRGVGAIGKAVVFARGDVELGETHAWLADESVRDVPHPGERISRGRPICTVFAEGRDAEACHAALVRRAECVYAELEGGYE